VKKLFISIVLVAIGAGLWSVVARTARFSIKKWDASFETVLRHHLSEMGLTNQDLLSSVHQVQKDTSGEWVVHRITMRALDPDKRAALEKALENAGAHVSKKLGDNNQPMLLVKRGSRVYQEISFVK